MSDNSALTAQIGFSHLPDVATLTPAQAQHEIGETMAGRHLRGYFDSGDPGHAAAVARLDALHARLHAGEDQQDEAPAELPPQLAAHEIGDKIANHLAVPYGTPDGDELREGLARAAVALDLDHADLGTAIVALNHAIKGTTTTTAEEAEEVLRQEWGDAYATNLASANRALTHLERSRPGARAFLEQAGMLNDPTTIGILARAGARGVRR
jgi:hypothetical protein